MSSDLPIGWVSAPLDQVFEPRSLRVSPIEFSESPYVGMEHVEAHTNRLLGTVEASSMSSSAARFYAGDVLYGRMRPYLNKVVSPRFDGLASAEFIVFPEITGVDNRFLLWRLSSSDFVEFACSQYEGDRPRVKFEQLGKFELLVPPATEQIRIVEKLEELLSDLDAGVAELKAAQRKLAQYRQSLLKAAVEGALTADWRAARASSNQPQETGADLLQRILTERHARWETRQLAKFVEQGKTPPKGWQQKYPEPFAVNSVELPILPVGWCYCDLETIIPPDRTGTRTGPFGSLLKKHEHRLDGIPVVGIENIDRMRFIPGSKIHVSAEKADQLREYDLWPGDVVISRSGTVGEICAIPSELGEARFSTNIMRVRLTQEWALPDFFCLVFNGSPLVLNQVRTLCAGSTRDFLNTEILKSLAFPLPPAEEQHEILAALKNLSDSMEEQEQAIQVALKQASAQRKNILKAAFAGQLVPQDPNDEPASVLLERIRAERAAQGASGKKRGRTPRTSA